MVKSLLHVLLFLDLCSPPPISPKQALWIYILRSLPNTQWALKLCFSNAWPSSFPSLLCFHLSSYFVGQRERTLGFWKGTSFQHSKYLTCFRLGQKQGYQVTFLAYAKGHFFFLGGWKIESLPRVLNLKIPSFVLLQFSSDHLCSLSMHSRNPWHFHVKWNENLLSPSMAFSDNHLWKGEKELILQGG